ncbi:MAG: class I SAM-dependent methyltransferase [Bacteroidia bacterium]
MFFSDRIKNIKETDKVLEIGPGADPHERSDVLLEYQFENEADFAAQFGHNEKLKTDKQIVFYKGDTFPFKDDEFDYIICSHVLEHVEDVPKFLSEVFRVAKKGYFEFPTILYDYLYNFDVHLNYLNYKDGKLIYMKKADSPLASFRPVQDFYYQSLKKGYVGVINELLPFMMQGFEWQNGFECIKSKAIDEVVPESRDLPIAPDNVKIVHPDYTMYQLIRKMAKKILKPGK